MSETFLFLTSAGIAGLFIVMAVRQKISWKSAARKATASLLLLWVVGIAGFAAGIGSSGGELNYNGNSFSIGRDASKDSFTGAVVVLILIGVIGGLLSVIAPDNNPNSKTS